MAEPLFGSTSQFWPVTSSPAFGYLHTTMPLGNRAMSALSPVAMQGPSVGPVIGLPAPGSGPSDPYAGSSITPPFAGPTFTGLPGVVPNPIGVPAFTGTEVVVGVTAPALLTAVAMRRGQPLGPVNDQEIEDFLYDAFDLIPGTNEVEVRCEGGRATITGSVPHKRLKRDVGEIAWAIPTLNDVQNNVTVTARRRSRGASREEAQPTAARKQT